MAKKWEAKYIPDIIVPNVRCDFVCLAERDTVGKYATNKYKVTALVEKEDKATIAMLKDAIEAVGEVSDWSELEHHPFLDGKGEIRDGDGEKHVKQEDYHGCIFFNALTAKELDVLLLDEEGEPYVERDVDILARECYSGAYYALELTPVQYKEGHVTFYLKSVCKVGDAKKIRNSSFERESKARFMNALQSAKSVVSKAKETPAKKKAEVAKVEEKAAKKGDLSSLLDDI